VSGTGDGEDAITVGIDIGTTSVKALAVDAGGAVLARARMPHGVRSPTPGAFEHDVDVAWRANVLGALSLVAGPRAVAAVNVSAMVPSLGAVDGEGRAVGPGLLYGDRRGARADVDPTEVGDAGELLAFLRWQARSTPGARYWPAQAVANHALTGRGVIDSTTAMTAVPLFDLTGWDAALAREAGSSPDCLPEIVNGVEPAGVVLEGLAAAGAVVGGGTIDALAEQLVAGANSVGDVHVLCGSTLITWAVVDDWAEVPGLWTVPHTVAGKALVGGPSNAGGLFLDRVLRWLGPNAASGLQGVQPGDLPVWLPYVRGERTPLHRRDLGAALLDLGLQHQTGEVLQAAYEAVGFVVRHHLDLAATVGIAPRRIVATGGGTQVWPWVQALADCTGLPVDLATVPEGAALGSAFIARCAAGLEGSMTDAGRWASTGRTVEPRPPWVEAAAARYERFRAATAAAVAS